MKGPLARLLRISAGGSRSSVALGGFVDSLLQTFENCRPGLTEAEARRAEAFFGEIYDKERARLRDAVRQEPHLRPGQQDELFAFVDGLVTKVVIPGYVRLAVPFTRRERNDFYLAAEPWHGLERVGWAAAGMVLGGFVVWAPFIPIWSKEWVLVFAVGGLLLPNLRRLLALRRFQGELNRLVGRADAEIWRLDLAYLTAGAETAAAEAAVPADALSEQRPLEGLLRERSPDAVEDGRADGPSKQQRKLKQGGR